MISKGLSLIVVLLAAALAVNATQYLGETPKPLTYEEHQVAEQLERAERGELIETLTEVLLVARRSDQGRVYVHRGVSAVSRPFSVEELARLTGYVTRGRAADARYAVLAERFLTDDEPLAP